MGFTGLKCDEYIPNVIGDKCDTCQGTFFNYPSFCETKILVATGFGSDTRNTEIVDLEDASFQCILSQYPTSAYSATGGLVGNTALICGGGISGGTYYNSCYSLKEDGAWKLDESSDLNTARHHAANGYVIMNSKLVLAGGFNGNRLATIEVVAPNEESVTLPISLPAGIAGSCIVPWDTNTFMIIGGYSGSDRRETYFFNMVNNERTNGPSLLTARRYFGCHSMNINAHWSNIF